MYLLGLEWVRKHGAPLEAKQTVSRLQLLSPLSTVQAAPTPASVHPDPQVIFGSKPRNPSESFHSFDLHTVNYLMQYLYTLKNRSYAADINVDVEGRFKASEFRTFHSTLSKVL